MGLIANLLASRMFHLDSKLEMGLALTELYGLLLSKQIKGQEAMTIQETNMMMAWANKTLRIGTIGFAGANIVSMLMLWNPRLPLLIRCSLSLGASTLCVSWYYGRFLESSTERFLSMEGSRIQRELANIMLRKYSDNPVVLRRLPKHFYSEEVYQDSSPNKPKLKWHFRNFCGDPASHYQDASYDEIKTDSSESDAKKTTIESEDVYVNTAADASQNPFDFVFGLPGSAENIPSPNTSST